MVDKKKRQTGGYFAPLLPRTVRLLRSRRFWYGAMVVLGVVVILQLLIPRGRALPGASVDGQSIGLKSEQEIESFLTERYKDATVVTVAPETSASFTEAGIAVDESVTAVKVVGYPLWQRIIPFSFVYKLFHNAYQSTVEYGELPLSQWAKKVSEACYVAARDATIAATSDNTLGVIPSQNGTECNEKEVIASLKSTQLASRMIVDAKKKTLAPKRTDQQVSAQLKDIQTVIDQGISVKVLDTVTQAQPEDIISWLTFEDGADGALVLGVDAEKVQPFIASLQQPIYIAPGTTVIYTTDGQETNRTTGATGRGIDSAALIESLRSQLRTLKTATIEAKVVSIAPKETFRRSYTNSAAGLQALLNDLATEKGDMAIAVTELGGQQRNVSANGSKQYHPASTYKLVVAYSVVKRIEAGQLKWEDQINGQTVDGCMTKMIVNSDNACAEAFAEKFSWKAIQADAAAIGMARTNLNSPDPVSTVTDQVLLLKKLQANQLMKPENATKILDLMKRQVYRAGVPAGVSVEVADKVGFMSGLLHDSAIVYAPNGTYLISVYSSGGTWGDIADVTRRINALITS